MHDATLLYSYYSIFNSYYKDTKQVLKPRTRTFSFEKYGYFRKEDILSAKTLKEVWPEISSYIKERNVALYDKEKSIKILHDSLIYCGIDMPYFRAVDICDMVYSSHEKYTYSQLARSCGYSNNFKNGDVYENLRLFRACIEYGAQNGNNALQKAFGVKSKAILLTEAPPPPPRSPYVITINPSDYINHSTQLETSKMSTSETSPKKDSFWQKIEAKNREEEERRARLTPEERAKEDRFNRIFWFVIICACLIWYFFS